jgi:hypothetical protein
MFCNPNGAAFKRHSNRIEKSGLLTQSELMSCNPQGYSCIRVLPFDMVLLHSGGISE